MLFTAETTVMLAGLIRKAAGHVARFNVSLTA